ncbi:MAG: lysine 5,6-aminomutase subunit alpha [Chloroflexota bacterium]
MTPTLGPGDFTAEREELLQRAAGLAKALVGSATGATTLGRERAILRLIGVGGLDRKGRPLAAEVVDRYVGGEPSRLAMGIGLPFSLALLEYDTDPQQLALDVAAGSVDLGLEAELLAAPERRAAATEHFSRLAAAAVDRIDDNRVARTELLEVLHDRRAPWIGATLRESSVEQAEREAAALVRAGLDLVRVEVPTIRELAVRLGELGHDVGWRPRQPGAEHETTPAGSQRGIARLRDVLDRAAAERGAYVRLVIAPPALAGPEGAIVAAFERADLLELDPMGEMFVTGVDPERALVDFAFAVRVARRAGVALHLDAGPLVVAPDLGSGMNADAATRAGRSLALQLLTVLVARANGIPDSQVIVGALPLWLDGESDLPVRAAAELALRRALYQRHRLSFVQPPDPDDSGRWAAIVAGIQPGSGVALIQPQAERDVDQTGATAGRARWAAEVAGQLDGSDGPRLAGAAREHARRTLAAAAATLDLIGRDGWPALTGAAAARDGWGQLGADAVAPSGVAADPVEQALAG